MSALLHSVLRHVLRALAVLLCVTPGPATADDAAEAHIVAGCGVSEAPFSGWKEVVILDGKRPISGIGVFHRKRAGTENRLEVAIVDERGCAVTLAGFVLEAGPISPPIEGFFHNWTVGQPHYLAPVERVIQMINRRVLEACGPEPADEAAQVIYFRCRAPFWETVEESGVLVAVFWNSGGIRYSASVVGFEGRLVGYSVWNNGTDERTPYFFGSSP